jgi:hypothetical protein
MNQNLKILFLTRSEDRQDYLQKCCYKHIIWGWPTSKVSCLLTPWFRRSYSPESSPYSGSSSGPGWACWVSAVVPLLRLPKFPCSHTFSHPEPADSLCWLRPWYPSNNLPFVSTALTRKKENVHAGETSTFKHPTNSHSRIFYSVFKSANWLVKAILINNSDCSVGTRIWNFLNLFLALGSTINFIFKMKIFFFNYKITKRRLTYLTAKHLFSFEE